MHDGLWVAILRAVGAIESSRLPRPERWHSVPLATHLHHTMANERRLLPFMYRLPRYWYLFRRGVRTHDRTTRSAVRTATMTPGARRARLCKVLLWCFAGSALLTVGSAAGLHWLLIRLDRSERYAIYSAGDLWPGYRLAWPAKNPANARVLAATGVGITYLEIRWPSPDSNGVQQLRCFETYLGWPQAFVSTGWDVVGLRGAIQLEGWVLPDGATVPKNLAPRTTVLWSGVAFDLLTFGLPLLAAATWSRRLAGSDCRRARFAATLAALGWLVGLGIPECGLMLANVGGIGYPGLVRTKQYATPSECGPAEIVEAFTPAGNSTEQYWGFEATNLAVTWRRQDLILLDNGGRYVSLLRRGETMTAGWPLPAFAVGDSASAILQIEDISQLRVQWDRWAVNVAVLVCVGSIWLIPSAVRRRVRRTRGQCPECGYPLVSPASCPECGPKGGTALH